MLEKYDRIGTGYNETRKADPYLLSRMLHHLQLKPSGNYLDVGCGTGNYTIRLQEQNGRFTGVEPSLKMLEIARQRSSAIQWVQGKAERLPLADKAYDAALASLTLHHWTSLGQGFQELRRVLQPEAKVLIFTSTSEQMQGYWLNHYFPKMLADSIAQMPTYTAIETALHQEGFEIEIVEKYFIKEDLQDQFLYCGKHDPSLYLDPIIRKGISSFSDLSTKSQPELS